MIIQIANNVVTMMIDFKPKPNKTEIPAELKNQIQDMHNALVEAAAENDEALMEKYFEEGNLDYYFLTKIVSKILRSPRM